MARIDNRKNDQIRDIKITRNYTKYAEGSVLIEMGSTKVICTASIEDKVPPFLRIVSSEKTSSIHLYRHCKFCCGSPPLNT